MAPSSSDPTYSELDSRRFNRRIYRASVEDAAAARQAAEFCRRERVDMLIARCPAGAVAAAQALEGAGLRLMDTLVYYTGKTERFLAPPSVAGVEIRRYHSADAEPLAAVARAAFAGYLGHYHADPLLDARAATEGYLERLALSTGRPDFDTLVAVSGGQPVGFLTLNHHQDPADIELNAVAPEAQGRGIYDGLVKAAGLAARERGRTQLTVSTQLNNVAPQKVWVRNGLEPHHAIYTFHGWFDT